MRTINSLVSPGSSLGCHTLLPLPVPLPQPRLLSDRAMSLGVFNSLPGYLAKASPSPGRVGVVRMPAMAVH